MQARPGVKTLTRIRPYISRAAHQVRRQIGRFDNAEVRKARRLARATRAGSVDVVYLGDSTTIFVAEYDTDRRPLHQMLQDRLGQDLTIHTLHGGSYNPPLHDAFLRQVDVVGGRPLVVVSLAPRMLTLPWAVHPAYGQLDAATEDPRGVPAADPGGIRPLLRTPAPHLGRGLHDRRLRASPQGREGQGRRLGEAPVRLSPWRIGGG
jgi:hypothetical protein